MLRFALDASLSKKGYWHIKNMNDLLKYIQSCDSAAAQNFVAATPEQITKLEKLSGQNLPRIYREFLEIMGGEDPRFCRDLNAYLNIQEIIEYYEEEEMDKYHPVNLLLVGASTSFENLYNQLSLPTDQGDNPPIIHTVDGEGAEKVSTSLIHLLFQEAFYHYQIYSSPFTLSFRVIVGHTTSKECEEFCLKQGLSLFSHSDEFAVCASNEDIHFYERFKYGGKAPIIAGKTKEAVDSFSLKYTQHFAAKLYPQKEK